MEAESIDFFGTLPTSIRLYGPTLNLLMMGVGPHPPKV
jgi:hypothetical protein